AAASDSLKPLLAEIGRTWVPALLANAEALRSGSDTMRTTIDGQPWEQPTFPYHGRCLQALRAAYAEQSEAARSAIAELLTGTGCEPLLTSA
ncbi:MAG: glutathione S-transferase, partial [Pseudomonadota bacterium]